MAGITPNPGNDTATTVYWSARRMVGYSVATLALHHLARVVNLELLVGAGLAVVIAVACFRTAGKAQVLANEPVQGAFRLAWRLFGAAAVAWALGSSLALLARWAQFAGWAEPPGLSALFELLYLGSLVLLLAASLSFPAARDQSWLDGLVAGASLTAIVIAAILLATSSDGSQPQLSGSFGAMHFALLYIAGCSLLWRMRPPALLPTALLAIGLLVLAFWLVPARELVGPLAILFATHRSLRSSPHPLGGRWARIVAKLPTGLVAKLPSWLAARLLTSGLVVVALLAILIAWFQFPRDSSIIAAYGLGLIVLQVVRRFFGPSPGESLTGGRPSRSKSPDVILTGLGLLTVWLLYQTLLVSPRPSADHQGLAFAIRGLTPKADAGVRIDVHMGVPRGPIGCRNPVSVTAVISGTPEFWRQHEKALTRKVQFGIGFYSKVGAIRNPRAGMASDAAAPLRPGDATVADSGSENGRSPVHIAPIVKQEDWYGYRGVFPGSVEDWSSSRVPLVLQFEADWVARRSLGSCYVRLPSLTGNLGEGARGALAAAIGGAEGDETLDWYSDEATRRVAASSGRIRLAIDANVLADKSARPVERYDAAQLEAIWTCSSSPLEIGPFQDAGASRPTVKSVTVPGNALLPGDADCGGFAVASTPVHEPLNAMSLILIGVVVSIWIEVAYEQAGRPGGRKVDSDQAT